MNVLSVRQALIINVYRCLSKRPGTYSKKIERYSYMLDFPDLAFTGHICLSVRGF